MFGPVLLFPTKYGFRICQNVKFPDLLGLQNPLVSPLFSYSPGVFWANLTLYCYSGVFGRPIPIESPEIHGKLILRPLKARSILVEQTTPVAHLIADAFWQRWCLE